MNLVGIKSDKKTLAVLVVNKNDNNDKAYKLKMAHNFPFKINYVITGFVNGDMQNVFILVENITDGNFCLHYFDTKSKKCEKLCDSSIIPFLIRGDDGGKCLVVQDRGVLKQFTVVNEPPYKDNVKKWLDGSISLRKYHSSATLDFNGDGKPDLALDTEKNNKSVLYLLIGGEIHDMKESLNVPNSSGPFVFEDFNRDGYTDLCYVVNDRDGRRI